MISYLKGTLLEKKDGRVVVLAGGVGYEVSINASTEARLPRLAEEAEIFISESTGLYGGAVTLYGFATREEKQMFLTFKTLKATGSKKALEYLEKTCQSLPDFRRAVSTGDAKVLRSLFGFTAKTADRLIVGLKGKLGKVDIQGPEKLIRGHSEGASASSLGRALSALSALGYNPAECRAALDSVRQEGPIEDREIADIIRSALRKL